MPYQPYTFQDAQAEREQMLGNQAQRRLIDYKLGQEQQNQGRAQTLRDIYAQGQRPSVEQIGAYDPDKAIDMQPNEFETDVKRHKFISGAAKAVKARLDSSGLKEGSPEYMDLFNKTMDAIKPDVARVMGRPEIVNTPNDYNATMALAAWDADSDSIKNNYILDYDAQGNPRRFNKATGQLESIQGIQGSAQYSPEAISLREQAKEREKGVEVTNEEGQTYRAPQRDVNPSFNVGNIRPVGSSTGFQSFNTPEEGLKAVDDQLRIYGEKHGVNTLAGVISRWSPPNENNTKQLIETASKRLGISPNREIDLSNPVVRQAITTAITLQERPVFGPVKSPSIKQTEQIKSDIAINEDIAKKQNQQNIEANDPVKLKGKANVDSIIDEMSGLYDELEKSGDITDPDKSASANLKAYVKGSAPGQAIGKMVGTKDQSIRNAILSKMPLLTQSIMKATGMTGGQLNSVPELENFMRAVTNPQMDIKSIKNQFKTLKNLFGSGNGNTSTKQTDNDPFSAADAILGGN
jgi:hypothetical protein